MGFAEHRRRLTDQAFATFGEDAAWSGREGTVRVRIEQADQDQKFGGASVVQRVTIVMVRSWEVGMPTKGERFVLTEAQNAGTFAINGKPLRDEKGVWRCPVERVVA